MPEDIAIAVHDLHKEFLLPHNKSTSLKQAFVNIGKHQNKTQQKVLDGINFEVKKGDFFGIVGRNGSGKSTLLKILAGVYFPTSGDVAINGKLTPFIELGVGFNPELSGRDNVFLNGALLGFSRKEMQVMYDEIVEFAELEEFMDKKLKNYSSGMQVRLAFSIAVKAKNDILIFDEVLAVGDEAFQRKCIDVFEKYKAEKQTVILVTHEMETVKKFCNRAILLHDGKIVETGNPRAVANKYSQLNQVSIDKATAAANQKNMSKYLRIKLLDKNGKIAPSYQVGESAKVAVSWDGLTGVRSIGINVFKESGEHVTGINSLKDKIDLNSKKSVELDLDLEITKGKYYLLVEAFREKGEILDAVLNGPRFSVTAVDEVRWSGLVELKHTWVTKA